MANLEQVVNELQQERDRLDRAIAALTLLSGNAPQPSRGRTMSVAARRRISAAQKARWAKAKGTPGSARPKRHISAAGIARIRAAAKARWARVKAGKKK